LEKVTTMLMVPLIAFLAVTALVEAVTGVW
jgi:hypothetical protein